MREDGRTSAVCGRNNHWRNAIVIATIVLVIAIIVSVTVIKHHANVGLPQSIEEYRVARQPQPASRMSFQVNAFRKTTIGPVAGDGPGLWLDASFRNDSDREATIPWGDTLYDDMFHFTIIGPDGKSVTGPTGRPAPPVLRSEKEFLRVAPGKAVHYKIVIGGLGRNVQPWYLRKPGKYLLNAEYTSDRDRYFDPATGGTIQVSNVWKGTLKSEPVTFTVAMNAANPQKGAVHKIVVQPGFAISGQVLDGSGKAVMDVMIEVTAMRTKHNPMSSVRGPWSWSRFALDRCLTDAQGRFVVESLPDDVTFYSLRAKHPLYLPATLEVTNNPSAAKFEANFVLGKGAEFRGRVVDTAGVPAYGTRISTYPSVKIVYADQNGLFTLIGVRPDEAQIQFWRPGMKPGLVTDAKPYQGGEVTWQIVLGPDTKK